MGRPGWAHVRLVGTAKSPPRSYRPSRSAALLMLVVEWDIRSLIGRRPNPLVAPTFEGGARSDAAIGWRDLLFAQKISEQYCRYAGFLRDLRVQIAGRESTSEQLDAPSQTRQCYLL